MQIRPVRDSHFVSPSLGQLSSQSAHLIQGFREGEPTRPEDTWEGGSFVLNLWRTGGVRVRFPTGALGGQRATFAEGRFLRVATTVIRQVSDNPGTAEGTSLIDTKLFPIIGFRRIETLLSTLNAGLC